MRCTRAVRRARTLPLNESPSEKEGKSKVAVIQSEGVSLNESPSEKEGKCAAAHNRKHNSLTLNESPSEKEGKFSSMESPAWVVLSPSMKVPPKRKGN